MFHFVNSTLVLPRLLLQDGELQTNGNRISALGRRGELQPFSDATRIDLSGKYLVPGYIDLHVHGGSGSDFMDGTEEAFETVCRCHAKHGTTSLTPTTTVARHDQHLRFLELCRQYRSSPTGGAKVLGAHIYGPYFNPEAKGCHPSNSLRPPTPDDYEPYFQFRESICSVTVAPELPGSEKLVQACRLRGIVCNAGHSYATFEQMEKAVRWGIRHVDHLFCAMSDRARLRQSQTYPMRGGVMEAALYFDELTTEVIADGKHLQAELLNLAYKVKGPDRLALVTDANRAVDMPDGEYWFGPLDGGETILRKDDVGVMPDGRSLASGVMGMDHMVKTFYRLTKVPLFDVIRMATLTPARILGLDEHLGSLQEGKQADLLVLDSELNILQVFIDGQSCPFNESR
jgi:N-acetylglucosamine-6-phosphate deacetylase